MAKASNHSGVGRVSFGKKSFGKMKKSYGPKEEKPKKYRGQGR